MAFSSEVSIMAVLLPLLLLLMHFFVLALSVSAGGGKCLPLFPFCDFQQYPMGCIRFLAMVFRFLFFPSLTPSYHSWIVLSVLQEILLDSGLWDDFIENGIGLSWLIFACLMVIIIRVGLNVCFHYSIALDFGEYVLFLEAGSLRVQREREREPVTGWPKLVFYFIL